MLAALTLDSYLYLFPLAAFCLLASLSGWMTGLRLAILAMFFGGIVAMNLANGAIAVAFRDIFIITPLYVAFFAGAGGVAAVRRLPGFMAILLFAIVASVMLATLHSFDRPIFQVLVGLRTWLFYIPFIFVGVALAARPERMFALFRFVLICGLVVCAVGLVESVLVRVVGFEEAITWFYGKGAAAATQDFGEFDAAGGIYRIPGTFSFVSQYGSFLYFYLALAAIEAKTDPNGKYRKLGQIAFAACIFAMFLSGSRAAPIVALVMAATLFVSGELRARGLIYLVVLSLAGLFGLRAIGFDPIAAFAFSGDLAATYTEDFIPQQFLDGLNYGPLGDGIGSNTSGSRYYVPDVAPSEANAPLSFESYFAKTSAEMGWVGLAVILAFFVLTSLYILAVTLRHRGRLSHSIVVPLAFYIGVNLVTSAKGYPLDNDPNNLFFWMSLGLIISLDRELLLHVRAQRSQEPLRARAAAFVSASRPVPTAPRTP